MSRQEQTELIESYLKEWYKFRYNSIANRIEYKEVGGKANKETVLTDYLANSIRRKLLYAGYNITKSDFHSLLNSDFIPIYNPFKSYFKLLPEWNMDDTDYIREMASKVNTTNNELWLRCFTKWLVGLVACSIDEDVVNQTAIIFTGRQGIGKTTFLKRLVPDKLKDYYYEGTINPNTKDSLTNLAECFLINLDELENLTKKDAGGLKEIITKTSIRMRRPYGTIQENFPRRASFCGSVNNKEFLKDTTGNRRFLCFEALSFDNSLIVDIERMYAQALYLWKTGFQFWLDKEDIEEIDEHNKEYKLVEPEEDALLGYFEAVEENVKGCELLTTTEIHRRLMLFGKLPSTNASVNQLGKVLHAHEFKRRKSGGQQLWIVKPRTDLRGNKV